MCNNNKVSRFGFVKVYTQLYALKNINTISKMQSSEGEPKRTQRYVDEAFRLVMEKPGVEEVLIMNRSGVPVKTTMGPQEALQHACLYDNLREKCQAFLHKMEPPQPLVMLRVRTKNHEVIITPDAKITILVVQNAHDSFMGSLYNTP
ncbi:dynein light chain roadblock-type 2 [Drosophila nasuta]|uniref:Dynein light chain roadblock-type 2 n=1 Tax=Drosophila albomicans TaxID=7291 RepID=A0A6P8WZL1_DROAB|nr:dynein light chain roadblock-type 2 [Drosophila albomicans]XP_060653068.1 dynein light chain roadblock-type 2 [Drosophila nasuta]